MYLNATSCIKLSRNTATHFFPCRKGVQQGCIVLYVLMYADDIVLLSSRASWLKKRLHTLSEYCKQWKLEMNNTEKTIISVFGKDTNPQTYTFNGMNLQKVKSYKYLAIWFSINGKFTRDMEHLSDKLKYSVQTTLKQLGHPQIPIVLQL